MYLYVYTSFFTVYFQKRMLQKGLSAEWPPEKALSPKKLFIQLILIVSHKLD